MRGKGIQSFSNATAQTLLTLSGMSNAGVMIKVIVRGTNAVSAMMWEDTFTAWRYQIGGTYQNSGIGPATTQNIAGTHTAGTLAWANVTTSTPSLTYTQGANGYALEYLEVYVVCRDGCNCAFNASFVSSG